jgi:hypothetical protein
MKQPAKGLVLMLVAIAVGAVMGTVYFYLAGGGVSPPTPMLAQCTIVSVVVTFWWAIMWGGWPITSMIKNPVPAGFVLVVACYALNYILFRIFFNYGFLQGAPVYVPELDPQGMFNGWYALVFYLAAIWFMFLLLHFDLWPLTTSRAIMKQPTLGIVWTILALVIGGALYYIGVVAMGMDVVQFMVRGPIPFIYGTIIVLNMMQASLFAKLTQPLKGLLSAIAAAIIGLALSAMYGALAPTVTGPLMPGPPAYEFEIWLASALLGVTFPFLVFYAEFFKLWPLQKVSKA